MRALLGINAIAFAAPRAQGAPPNVEHLMSLIDPERFVDAFTGRVEARFSTMPAQDGIRPWRIRAKHQRDGAIFPRCWPKALRAVD